MYSAVTPLTTVLAGIDPLPVTTMPARIPVVSAIGTSVSPLPTLSFVFCVKLPKFTTTSLEFEASKLSTKLRRSLESVLAPILMFCAAPPISKLETFVSYKLPLPVLCEVSLALPTSRPSERSSAVPHIGLVPSDFKKLLFLPIFNVFSDPVDCAYSISPVAYVVIAVPPLATGTGVVKFDGFKKYALSRASSVPASITPSLMNTSPLPSLLTSN